MPFDPDAYLGASQSGFDPDAYLGEPGPVPSQNTPPPSLDPDYRETIDASTQAPRMTGDQAEVLGMGQGVFGLGDEISAGMRAVKDTAMTPERKWADTLQLWQAYKQNAKRDVASAEQQHPGRTLIGQLPVALASGMATTPAAVGQIASPVMRHLANTGVNAAQSIANNYGRDTLSAGNVVKDVAAGELVGGALSGAQYLARRGIKGAVGDVMQAPQAGVNKTADFIGDKFGDNLSDEVKNLRTSQQSYLTEAGKKGVEAQASLSGDDFASRLAKASSEGRATIGPGQNFDMSPAEFGDDLQKIMDSSFSEAVAANPLAAKVAAGPEFDPFEDVISQIRRSPEARQGAGTVRRGGGGGAGDNVARDVAAEVKRLHAEKLTGAMSGAQSVLDQWRAAKAAQSAAQGQAEEIAPQLATAQRTAGRDVIGQAMGKGVQGAIGATIAGPVGALAGAMGGQTMGKVALGGIDWAGDVGARLAKTAGIAQQWATRDDALGKAAQWALSAHGPALAARLATLAKLPEAQQELQTP